MFREEKPSVGKCPRCGSPVHEGKGQLKSGELTEGDVKQLYAKAQETAQTAGQDKDTLSLIHI